LIDSTIFEKLILKSLLEIKGEAGVDLTDEKQHGFKRTRLLKTSFRGCAEKLNFA
jgi:hypothetical protein